VVGDAAETIGHLAGPFDLVFIDADKTGYLRYYQAVLPKLSAGGVIVVDNTLHEGLHGDDPDTERSIRAVHRLNQIVAQDPRVEQVVLAIRDGVTLIRPIHR
jgi:caffeoyl-CoA O-methyltransferase